MSTRALHAFMREPHASTFSELVKSGAASRDIHDVETGEAYASSGPASDGFLQRELARVDQHQRKLLPILERHVGRTPRVLDFGCGTAGTTVALALSPTLSADQVIGVDANAAALEAGRVRAAGHGIDDARVELRHVPAGEPLPYDDGAFDLVVSVSVLEFVSHADDRARVVAELKRVTRPGGYVFLTTPKPRLREYHSGRWFGDWVRREGFPWAAPPRWLRAMFSRWTLVPLDAYVVHRALDAVGVRGWEPPERRYPWLTWAARWQKLLAKRPMR